MCGGSSLNSAVNSRKSPRQAFPLGVDDRENPGYPESTHFVHQQNNMVTDATIVAMVVMLRKQEHQVFGSKKSATYGRCMLCSQSIIKDVLLGYKCAQTSM